MRYPPINNQRPGFACCRPAAIPPSFKDSRGSGAPCTVRCWVGCCAVVWFGGGARAGNGFIRPSACQRINAGAYALKCFRSLQCPAIEWFGISSQANWSISHTSSAEYSQIRPNHQIQYGSPCTSKEGHIIYIHSITIIHTCIIVMLQFELQWLCWSVYKARTNN